MGGVIGYGTYVPYHRLSRQQIAAVLGGRGGKGTRSVASYDEDAASMAVEAGRAALRGLAAGATQRLLFATTSPPYLEKTNANVVHAALGLDEGALALDVVGSVKSGVGALLMAAESPVQTMAVLSDIRIGLPGGADEQQGGDAAAAFVFGDGAEVIAEVVSHATATAEFLDRWRLPSEPASNAWEDRFGEHAYRPLADAAFAEALKRAAVTPDEVDLLVVTGVHDRAARAVARTAGVGRVADDQLGVLGNSGTAHPGLLLAQALDDAEPDQVIVLMVLADGATAVVLRTTDALLQWRAGRPTVAEQLERGADLRYADFLTWRGFLRREPPRRPDPAPPAAPPSLRSDRYKHAFVGSRCTATSGPDGQRCDTVHVPPSRICLRCRSIDEMVDHRMADAVGTVVSFTLDHLAYSPNPPLVAAVVDFDGGGRLTCELTDLDPHAVQLGDRVEMTFRRTVTAGGIHNYFWKARPCR